MGKIKLLSDKRVRRWPYHDDGQWKLDAIHRPKRSIGEHPASRKNRGYAEYQAKYGSMELDEFMALVSMTRKERRLWCLALRKRSA